MRQPKIWGDAGHGGSDSGAVSFGLVEKTINLTMAIACKSELERHSVQVGMSRTTDVFVDLEERCQMANAWGADYFISFHNNAGGGDGMEIIHSIYHGAGDVLANTIAATVQAETGQNLRRVFSQQGQHGDYFCVIRDTKMPAIIVEGAFLDNDKDNDAIDTIAKQVKFGIAYAHGILNFLGIAIKPFGTTIPAGNTTTGTQDIRDLQALLNNAGISDKDGHRLTVDGVAGDLTLSALAKVLIRRGMTNVFIGWIQHKLNVTVDNTYGVAPYHETYDAICKFQKQQGLTVDGIVGINTWTRLVR